MSNTRSSAWKTVLSRRAALGGVGAAMAGPALARTSAAQEATPVPETTDDAKKIFYMFVQTAQSGSILPKPDEDGVYQVTLEGAAAQTIYFSDRPERVVGNVPTGQFLEALGFTPENPPNAAIVTQTEQGEDILVVELLNPAFDAEAGTLTYDVIVLDDYQGDGLGQLSERQEDLELAETFGYTSLFIDDCPDLAWCTALGFSQIGPVQVRVAAIPGGPYGRCWKGLFRGCLPCSGENRRFYTDLCNAQISDCGGECSAN